MGLAVRAEGLVKDYGTFRAVDHLDLEVPVGGCFGILGPNGAGKTTLMRMVACVSPPTMGRLEVLGADVTGDRRAIKQRLGVVPQGMTLDTDLTVRENLVVHARYHDLAAGLAQQRADELLAFARLEDRALSGTEQLSGGMQRRLLIARALVNDPELVILDEPTTGLDPQARQLVWERLRGLRREGKTLLVTTHYMEEAAVLCDRLVVVDRGRVIAAGSPRELIESHVPPRVVEVHGSALGVDQIASVLGGTADDVEVIGDRVVAYGRDGDAMAARLRAADLGDAALVSRDATLEDVFLRLTGHGLAE